MITVAGDLYGAVVAGGIVFAFLFQVFVNVGMTMGIAPVTGIPLPFVTVGGSSMVANLVRGRRPAGDPRPRPGRRPPAVTPVRDRAARRASRSRATRRAPRRRRAPLLVTGVLAEQLARELRRGRRRRRSSARTAIPASAAALVRVVAGAATPEDERVLRAATRALVPTVVVQTGEPAARIPYVLATDRRRVPSPARASPSTRSPHALAARSGAGRGRARGARSRSSRDAVQSRRIEDGAVTAGALAVAGGGAQRLPVLALAQARMLSDVATAGGAARPEAPRAVAEAVGAAAGGSPRRGARRPDARPPPAASGTACCDERRRRRPVTYALATAFRRVRPPRSDRSPRSVRSGS